MASQTQYDVASNFMRSYKDALACVEQIAERRQSYLHYEREAGSYTQALAAGQVRYKNCEDGVLVLLSDILLFLFSFLFSCKLMSKVTPNSLLGRMPLSCLS